MSDDRLQRLHRAWLATKSLEDAVLLDEAARRVGEISAPRRSLLLCLTQLLEIKGRTLVFPFAFYDPRPLVDINGQQTPWDAVNMRHRGNTLYLTIPAELLDRPLGENVVEVAAQSQPGNGSLEVSLRPEFANEFTSALNLPNLVTVTQVVFL